MPTANDEQARAARTYNSAADFYDDPANSFWERFGPVDEKMSESDKGEATEIPVDGSDSAWRLVGDWERIASLVIGVAYLLVSPILFPADSWSHLVADILMRILSLAFPLACIWFADDLGEYFRDGTLAPEITTPSSGTFVRIGGWVLLLLPVLLFLLIQLLDYLYR
jgi:hypothetical protein